jgi:two-component system sensor histidine kinase QseC
MRCDEDCIHLRIGNAAPELEHRDLERLGERFWRKSPAREASRHGGLGLALARSLAELMHLRLEFHLEQGWLWAELDGLSSLRMPE